MQQNFFLKTARILSILILLSCLFVGCSNASTSSDYFRFPTIGEAISNGELELTVTSAKPMRQLAGKQAKDGYVFIAIIFEYKNIATYALDYTELPMAGLDDASYNQYDSHDELAGLFAKEKNIDLSVLMTPLQPNEYRIDVQVFEVPIDICNNHYLYLTFDVFTQEIELDIKAR